MKNSARTVTPLKSNDRAGGSGGSQSGVRTGSVARVGAGEACEIRRKNPMHLYGSVSVHRSPGRAAGPGRVNRCQNPMHQFAGAGGIMARQPRAGGTNWPASPTGNTGMTSHRRPEPHAPIRPPAATGPSERAGGRQHRLSARTPCTRSGRLFGKARQPGQATPHVQRTIARPALPTVSSGVPMRRW
jgi:hypothetical protein